MLRLKGAIGAYMLATAFMPTVAAQATTYYVATNGSDSNNGTSEGTPFRTVAKAAGMLINPGDTAYVKNGTYIERNVIHLKYSGTTTAPIKLAAYPGHAPVIDFVDGVTGTAGRSVLIQRPGAHNTEIAWVIVEGLTLKNGYYNLRWWNCRHCTVRHNWSHNGYGSGLMLTGSVDSVVDGNVVSSAGQSPTGAHGIYAEGTRLTITNNIVYDSHKMGLVHDGQRGGPHFDTANYASQEFADSHNWIVANNVFAYQRTNSGVVVWGSNCNNSRYENNIFYENAVSTSTNFPQGINFTSLGCTGLKIRNNLAYASGTGGRDFLNYAGATEGVHYTQSGNMVNTDNPQFLNAPATLPESPNFKLHERSQAIDKGLPLAATRIALGGTTRPQGRAYDIGAYEYSAGGDSQSPAVPTALRVH